MTNSELNILARAIRARDCKWDAGPLAGAPDEVARHSRRLGVGLVSTADWADSARLIL